MGNDKLLAQEISQELLAAELEKFEAAKVIYFREVGVIKADIVTLKNEHKKILETHASEIHEITGKIATLKKERSELAVSLSAEKTAKEKSLAGLDVTITERETERDAISLSFTIKEKEETQRLQDIENRISELTNLEEQAANATSTLKETEKAFDIKVEADTGRVNKNIEDIKTQTEVLIDEKDKIQALVKEKKNLLESLEKRHQELDEKLIKFENLTKEKEDLDVREVELNKDKIKFATESKDIKALQVTLQEKEKTLEITERALAAQKRKVLIDEKQLKEAQDG